MKCPVCAARAEVEAFQAENADLLDHVKDLTERLSDLEEAQRQLDKMQESHE